MNIERFNFINEELKILILEYQVKSVFDSVRFENLHKSLLKLISDNDFYEDLRIGFIDAYNKINSVFGGISWLINSDKKSYHTLLWQLHSRIMKSADSVPIRKLPKDIQEFNRILKSKKKIFAYEGYYLIVSNIGRAKGHITTIKVSEFSLSIEYNDHSPTRTDLLFKELIKRGYSCNNPKVLKNIFPKSQTSDNYFFTAEKRRSDDDLRELANLLKIIIDIDWIMIDPKKPLIDDECRNELLLLDTAFMLYDLYDIQPVCFLDIVKNLIRIS
jgi:hypothetical protein